MLYARIDLSKSNYDVLKNCQFITDPDIDKLSRIYKEYCCYKKFKSVMPIFPSEYTDPKNDVIGYYNHDKLVAWSLLRKYDNENVEAIQFSWNYESPELKLGIASLRNECAIYKLLGFKYLYLGEAHEYKKQIDGFEILKGLT